eukprot:gene11013-biopygen13406
MPAVRQRNGWRGVEEAVDSTDKIVRERDELAAKKRERRRKTKQANEEPNENKETDRSTVEVEDSFERETGEGVEEENIKKGKPNVQDLLKVIKTAGLEEALPQALILLELAAATPLTSVHCERVFNRMKKVVSPSRSTMLQARKEMLIFLQVEHAIVRSLSEQPTFKDNVVNRPKDNQREVYNGHKRVHALKFQSVVTPNGLIANLFGPVERRRHDSGMLNMSGLLHDLEHHSFSPTGQALCLYGDPAYPHRVHLQCPFARRADLTPEEEAFNQSMSQVRISVEWDAFLL